MSSEMILVPNRKSMNDLTNYNGSQGSLLSSKAAGKEKLTVTRPPPLPLPPPPFKVKSYNDKKPEKQEKLEKEAKGDLSIQCSAITVSVVDNRANPGPKQTLENSGNNRAEEQYPEIMLQESLDSLTLSLDEDAADILVAKAT